MEPPCEAARERELSPPGGAASSGTQGGAETLPDDAPEICSLAQEAVEEATRRLDDEGDHWASTGKQDGVLLSNFTLPNVRLPMYRGLLQIPADVAPNLSDIAQVMLSHHGRRFHDLSYDRSYLLGRCGPSAALAISFTKASPVGGPNFSVSACGVQRTAAAGNDVGAGAPSAHIAERITVAYRSVPEHIIAPHEARIRELCGGVNVQSSHTRLKALDVLRRVDGSVRVGFLLHTDASTVKKLPAFLLRKLFANIPAAPLNLIAKMGKLRMTPQYNVALTGPDLSTEEVEERSLDGQRLQVSTLFRGILCGDDPL